MRRFCMLFMIVISTLVGAEIANNIKHADTYYWLGIGEHGDMQAFAKGYEYLDRAEVALKRSKLSKTEKSYFQEQINALRSDIFYQEDMAHDTFYGVFPLSRILGNSIFSDAGAYGTFEFVDDPDVIAVCNGAEKIVETLNRSLKYSPQYGVVINSNPPNQALENEVRYIFNLDARFFVHTYQEISSSLSPNELEAFEANRIDSQLVTHLCEVMNNPYLALITIRQVDIVDDVYFFILEADTYWDNEGVPKFKMAEMSFCRDRRDAFIPLWILNLVLFALMMLIFMIFNKHKVRGRDRFLLWTMPVLAFLWGRLLPWVLNPLLDSFKPDPETLVKLSFWWLLTYGLVLICGTMLTWYLISKRASKLVKTLAPEGSSDLALICVGMGLSAYFGETVLIYNTTLVPIVIASVLIMVGVGFILGALLDCTRKSAGWFILPVLGVSASAGLIITRLQVWESLVLAAVTVIFALIAGKRTNAQSAVCLMETGKKQSPDGVVALGELSQLIVNPRYQKFPYFEKALSVVKPFIHGNSCRILLSGPSGRGKSATANALIDEMRKIGDKPVMVLKGECPDQDAHLNPYAPLQQALGHISGINFNSINQDNSQIDSILDSLMDSVIPFSSLLLPGDDSSGLQSRDQLNSLIYSSLIKLTKKSPVILYLDDLQWVDSATADFLDYLLNKINDDNTIPLLLIMTSRDNSLAESWSLEEDELIAIDILDDEQKAKILNDGLGFTEELSNELLNSFGNIATEKGEMFFLLSTLCELVREGAFVRNETGVVLSGKFPSVDSLPIPSSFAESVIEQIGRIEADRMIIECAACCGLEFEVDVLAKSLEMSRLAMLAALARIETHTDLIYDVGEFDDIYAFRSSAVLEVIRQNLKIYDFGPRNPLVPQIIREYHARLAAVQEKNDGTRIFSIANHYYAAGKLYAEKAIEFCIKAAHKSAALFQHGNAEKYLIMAKECAEVHGKTNELEGEFLKLEISESFVENRNQEAVAHKAIQYMKNHNELDNQMLLLISKSCYNAAIASGNQELFRQAVETAEYVIKRSTDQFVIAESKQLVAISLPRIEKDKILTNLKSAYQALLELGENSMRTRELQARIENSLAERLSYEGSEEKTQAEELFKHSIKLKEELKDLPGLARSWGGLGRLYLERDRIADARKCFEEDLNLSIKIGDIGGEVKMYSFIADCFSREENYAQATDYYQKSYQMAEGLSDRLFAARGLIIVGLKAKSTEEFQEYYDFLDENRDTAISIWSGFFDEIEQRRSAKEETE